MDLERHKGFRPTRFEPMSYQLRAQIGRLIVVEDLPFKGVTDPAEVGDLRLGGASIVAGVWRE